MFLKEKMTGTEESEGIGRLWDLRGLGGRRSGGNIKGML